MRKTTPRLRGLTLSLGEKRNLDKIEDKIEVSRTSHRLLTRTAKRKAIMLLIALSLLRQKNSYSLGNLHVGDC